MKNRPRVDSGENGVRSSCLAFLKWGYLQREVGDWPVLCDNRPDSPTATVHWVFWVRIADATSLSAPPHSVIARSDEAISPTHITSRPSEIASSLLTSLLAMTEWGGGPYSDGGLLLPVPTRPRERLRPTREEANAKNRNLTSDPAPTPRWNLGRPRGIKLPGPRLSTSPNLTYNRPQCNTRRDIRSSSPARPAQSPCRARPSRSRWISRRSASRSAPTTPC